jgi:ABC-type nitrate/sulfonate/bicarbonate transport system substrate-binding protein
MGAVHAFSSHNYELRAWLAHAGLDPEKDLELMVVPRSKMVEALANGEIDGFCVGDPWGQQAVEYGVGVNVATKADLYPFSPEKVLAFRDGWIKGHAETAAAVVEAISSAMEWASQSENHTELAQMLTQVEYLSVSPATIRHTLACEPRMIPGAEAESVPHFIGFDGDSRPSEAAALWLLAQMRRWGQVTEGQEDKIRGVFAPLVEGKGTTEKVLANDNPAKEAFDGVDFTSDDIETYWRSFPIGCES